MSKILITGGFGFIGSHLIEVLAGTDPSAEIHVIDNLSTNPLPLQYLLDTIDVPGRLTYDIASIADFFHQDDLPAFDQIYHLASPVGPAGVLQHGGNMVREVVGDIYALIDYCLRTGSRLVDISTSEVYGGGMEGYCSETAPKIVPATTTVRLEYAVAKLAAETAIINSCTVRGLDSAIVRPFNVAGPRQSPKGGFVLPRFIRQAVRGEPLTVFGDGSALRAFTHVKDVASGIMLTMERGKVGAAYNIGNPDNKTSIGELADRVISILDSRSTKELVDPRTIYGPLYSEANDKFPDAHLAFDELGWKPEYSIDDIIGDALKDYESQRSAGVAE